MLALLNPWIRWIKLGGTLAIAAAIGYGLWSLYHAGYLAGKSELQTKWDADKIRVAEANKTALLTYAEKINQAQEQHDHDQATIYTLATDARRLRVHLPTCGNGAAAGKDSNGTAGVFSDRVDQRFAELQARVRNLFTRCDQLNIDAIRANGAR